MSERKRKVTFRSKVLLSRDLLAGCESLPEMVSRLEEVRQDLLAMQRDGVELLDPVVGDGARLVTSSQSVADRHLMTEQIEFDAADEIDFTDWATTKRVNQ